MQQLIKKWILNSAVTKPDRKYIRNKNMGLAGCEMGLDRVVMGLCVGLYVIFKQFN